MGDFNPRAASAAGGSAPAAATAAGTGAGTGAAAPSRPKPVKLSSKRDMLEDFDVNAARLNPLISAAGAGLDGGAGGSGGVGGGGDNAVFEYDPKNLKKVKDDYIRNQLKMRETEFTNTRYLHMFLGTWNVNGKKPGEDIESWLVPHAAAAHRKGNASGAVGDGDGGTDGATDTGADDGDGEMSDVYAVGFQELDLTAEALLLGDTSRAAPWQQHMHKCLNKHGDYEILQSKQLVGILLVIFVKRDLVPHVREVADGMAAVGIMGMMGNKGGVAIRFRVFDSTICILNSHLNAHHDNIERRNQDHRDICRRVVFNVTEEGGGPGGGGGGGGGGGSTAATPTAAVPAPTVLGIFDHDHLWWIGDLNYRLNLPDPEIKLKIKQRDWLPLLAADQLVQQQQKGEAFVDFVEGDIRFAPTYKYDGGTDRYDTSEKKRRPAWCDRVMYRGNTGSGLLSNTIFGATGGAPAADNSHVQLQYYRRAELLTSDHKPVMATYNVKVKSVIPEKRASVYKQIVKQLDKMENEAIPEAAVSTNSCHFDAVRYKVPYAATFDIANTGQVIARYRFIPKLDEARYCKAWLSVDHPYGMLAPGEKVTVVVSVLVDNSTAPALNFGTEKFEDILILHLENGKDYFITVTGTYLPSCFGSSLEHLCNFRTPVRAHKPGIGVMTAGAAAAAGGGGRLQVPKELWRLVDHIYRHGMREEALFLQSGVDTELTEIRECLDTGAPLRATLNIHSIAESLIRFLDSLCDPVLPTSVYKQCLIASTDMQRSKAVVASLPSVNYNVFYYLVSFWRTILNDADVARAPDKLAFVFSSVLLKPDKSYKEKQRDLQFKARFLYTFFKDSINGNDKNSLMY